MKLKKIWILYVTLTALFLTGCDIDVENNMRNLEERDYATVLMIQETEGKRYHVDLGVAQVKMQGERSEGEEFSSFDCNSLEELRELYESVKGKNLSLAHLKVILLTNVYPMEESCDCLTELGKDKEIAKTVPVLEVQEPEALLRFIENMEQSFGSYISDLVRTGERNGRNIPWLKDYIKTVQEGENIMIYDLQIGDEGLTLVCKNNG